ncbi:ribonuclease Y [Enemella sp. A6]|uniref:ribonuclease Y n=1 Tax=Enemella sp. A6 TaxID=3440152 RepID=UPI003EBF3CC0
MEPSAWVLTVLLLLVLAAVVVLALVVVRGRRVAVAEQEAERAQAAEEARKRNAEALTALRAAAEKDAAEVRADADEYQRSVRAHADQVLREAERARQEAERARQEAEQSAQHQRDELRELRLGQERRDQRLAEREDRLAELRATLDSERADLDRDTGLHVAELERIAGLTREQARDELVESIVDDAKRRAVLISRDLEQAAVREGEARARTLLVDAMQRVASEQTTESVVATVELPSDDMKGRIIGREGRNIRSFEQVTGVNVMIDDTPGSVLLSCFDPVRRETARLTLEDLVADGRIHPARIEEVHERSQRRIAERCAQAAEDALVEVGIADLDPNLVELVGMLRYRTSYGQNVLKHLIECSHLAGLMAVELGLEPKQCRRAAFLHDIGKALTHEVEGSHALIGADLARRHGEHPEIVHAIEAHHNEVEPTTVVAVLTQIADQISGGRPGARRESLESYVKRLERLESIAASRDGVDKVFAMQAGREVRVMVDPGEVDDIEAQVLARDIVKQVEEELTYPGQIRVTVVRESRATEVAR